MAQRNLLAITTSPLPYGGQFTDGPGYRMWNLLHEVVRHHSVRVLSLYESFHAGIRGLDPISEDGIAVERPSHSPRTVQRRIRELRPDVLYLPWSSTIFLGEAGRRIPTVLDYVGPGLLEDFAANGRISLPLLRLKLASFRYGDFLITSGERERFYLLGLLAASGKLSAGEFHRDDPLIHVIRMTPPTGPPTAERSPLPRAGNELVVLLPGAFLPWYDYSMLASALQRLEPSTRSVIRLVVLGGNPRMPEVEARVRDTLTQGDLRGLVDFTGIVPFSQRAGYYLGSDVVLSIAPPTVEDELSTRTRIVDALWARVPLLTPGRDEYSARVLDAGAGFRYEPTPEGLAATLATVAADRTLLAKAKERMDHLLAGPFDVTKAARPLLEFLEAPRVGNRTRARGPGAAAGIWVRDLMKAIRTGRM